jgi:enoyl-CoA hydratase/carnithine racemase
MTDHIQTRSEGTVGIITLNRPDALNALSHDMTNTIKDQLRAWHDDDSIACVFVYGEGRAFCAGGDIRSIYRNGTDNIDTSIQFFRDEYQLNQLIYHYPKPYIAYLDGITMGGGVGISWHGSHRIVTENFSFAMPEVNISFFPDVGVRYHLARLPRSLGLYLALSGRSITADDALATGIATHTAQAGQADALIQQLAQGKELNTVTASSAFDHALLACYQHDSLTGIYEALTDSHPALAAEMADRSLFSLQHTFNAYQNAHNQEFDEIIRDDLEIAKQFLQHPDFYEGIRAALVDKDKKPVWVKTLK